MARSTEPQETTLRERGQLTLPAPVCRALGLQVGDRLELTVTEHGVLLTPRKNAARRALEEISRAFAEAGVTEEHLLEEGRRVREEISRKYYG